MTTDMHHRRIWSARVRVAVCATAIAALAGGVGASAMAQDAAGPAASRQGGGPPAAVLERMQRMRAAAIQARLDQAAARLQITASEEPAWQAYSKAVKSFAQPPARPAARRAAGGAAPDAAAMLKRIAAAAMTRAQRLDALADATGKLQAALSPNQQEVLNEIVRTQLRHMVQRRGGMMEMRGRGFGMRGPMMGGAGGFAMREFMNRGRGGPDAGPGRMPMPMPGGPRD